MTKGIVTVTMNPAIDKLVYVDQFAVGGLNRITSMRTDPGGKGINVSKAFSSYGVRQVAIGILGGKKGKELLSMLKKYKFRKDFLFVKEETRVNMKIHDNATGKITELNAPGQPVRSEDLELFFHKLKKHLVNSDLLVLSGSLPLGVPDCFYSVCIQIAEEMNIRVIFDADSKALNNGVHAKPYAIKPNIRELEQFTGKTLDTTKKIVSEIERLSNSGISLILVSLGEKGSFFHYKNKTYMVSPLNVRVKSTVGAGDAMVAALAYCILMDFSPEETAQITVAAGSLTAACDGSEMAEWQKIREVYHNVSLKEV